MHRKEDEAEDALSKYKSGTVEKRGINTNSITKVSAPRCNQYRNIRGTEDGAPWMAHGIHASKSTSHAPACGGRNMARRAVTESWDDGEHRR